MNIKHMSIKVLLYNEANKKVAILCNHQKTVSKAQESGLTALGDRLQMLKKQKQELVCNHPLCKHPPQNEYMI